MLRQDRTPPTAEDLERFREIQQLAYRCAETVSGGLTPGVTEKETAARMKTWLVDNGVDDWFHLPFAWFGDRTAFRHFRTPFDFFPSDRKLEEGMPFILDCAPIVAGYSSDIGYTGCLGENAVLDLMLDDLAAHRELILTMVKERKRFSAIYEAVDRLAARQGHENRHRQYPYHVIAHQTWRLSPSRGRVTVGRFGTKSLRTLFRTVATALPEGWSPLWNGSRRSNHPPVPGLWAVEPHLGFRDVGAKFEELLVVTEDDAFWLDDDLPHVRRWADRGITAKTVAV